MADLLCYIALHAYLRGQRVLIGSVCESTGLFFKTQSVFPA